MKTKNILIGTLVLMVLIMFVIIIWPSQPELQYEYVVVTATPTTAPTVTPRPTEIPDCTWDNGYDVVKHTGFDESRIQVTSSCEEEFEPFSKIAESRYYQVFRSNFTKDSKTVFYVDQVRRVDDWPDPTGEAVFPRIKENNTNTRVEGKFLLLNAKTSIDVEWTDLANRVLFITRIEKLEIVATNELIAPLNAERSTKPEGSNYYHPQDNSPKCLAWRALGGNAFPGSADYYQCRSR